jgi:hypothetical protein
MTMTTRTLALTAALVMGSATLASAESTFYLERIQDADDIVRFSNVLAEEDGVVEVYSFRQGRIGDLLGRESVSQGVNSDVMISVRTQPVGDLMAVLKVDGQVVASQEVDLDRAGM